MFLKIFWRFIRMRENNLINVIQKQNNANFLLTQITSLGTKIYLYEDFAIFAIDFSLKIMKVFLKIDPVKTHQFKFYTKDNLKNSKCSFYKIFYVKLISAISGEVLSVFGNIRRIKYIKILNCLNFIRKFLKLNYLKTCNPEIRQYLSDFRLFCHLNKISPEKGLENIWLLKMILRVCFNSNINHLTRLQQ